MSLTDNVLPAARKDAAGDQAPPGRHLRDRSRANRLTGLLLDVRRLARLASWTAVGASGLVVNSLVLWWLADGLSIDYLVAAVAATQFSSTWNFLWVDRWVFRGDKRSTVVRRWLAFVTFANVALLARIPLLAFLVSVLGVHYLVANAFTLCFTFLIRYFAQEKLSALEVVS
ncbi:MAG TPA: GtrA family protein [Nocardioides sp.]|jgi:dolichol-phosphate mannosyltransferase